MVVLDQVLEERIGSQPCQELVPRPWLRLLASLEEAPSSHPLEVYRHQVSRLFQDLPLVSYHRVQARSDLYHQVSFSQAFLRQAYHQACHLACQQVCHRASQPQLVPL